MSESILTSIKQALGIAEAHVAFDAEIQMHINSAFSTLNQLGVGPVQGYSIADKTSTWDELVGDDNRLNAVKSYLYLRVKMLFDPPDIGFVITAFKQQIEELEWRLNVTVDDDIPTRIPTPVLDERIYDGGAP